MRTRNKFINPAFVAIIVALLTAGVALLPSDPIALRPQLAQPRAPGEESPAITREQQPVGDGVVTVVDTPSYARPQTSASTELPGPVEPSNSVPGAVEPSSSIEMPRAVEPSGSTQMPSPVERSGSTEMPSAAERLGLTELPSAAESNAVVDAIYRFSARRQGQTLLVEGYVPDERTGDQLIAFARERFFDVAVINQARSHDGAPAGFSAGARFALEQLSFLSSGEALLLDQSIRLSGEALYAETGEQTCAKLTSLAPRGWTGTASIKWRREQAGEDVLPACQSQQSP
jgi:hypothetical protein